MNRYPITSARIRPLERPVSPFLSDVDRDQLRADYLGPQYTPQQYEENDIALRGQKLADSLRGKYRTYNELEASLNPQFQFATTSQLPVADPGSAAGAAELKRRGYIMIDNGGEEGGGPSYVAPGDIERYREYQAQNRAKQILGNELNRQQTAQSNAEAAQRQVDLRQANQLYGGLAEAGVSFAPGSLNRADVREDIWNSRGNIPGLVSRQSNDAEGYLRSPLSRSPFSMRWNPQQEYPTEGGDMVDPRAPRYQGATAGPNGVVESRISYPQADMDRFDIYRPPAGTPRYRDEAPSPRNDMRDRYQREGYEPDFGETNALASRYNRRLGPAPTASLSSFRSRLRPRY